MQCPFCPSQSVVKNGKYSLRDGQEIQHHLCKDCGKRFSQKTGTPMAGLRIAPEIVALGLKMPGEGMGVQASGRVLDKAHSTILRWEARMGGQAQEGSPPVATDREVPVERDELYARVGENLPPLRISRLDSDSPRAGQRLLGKRAMRRSIAVFADGAVPIVADKITTPRRLRGYNEPSESSS